MRVVDLGAQARGVQRRGGRAGGVDVTVGDRQRGGLQRREPERQLAGVVLEQDPDEALEGAEQRAVDHHRAVVLVVGARVGEVEALGQVVVGLHRADLPRAAERVGHVQVDLGRVERALALGDLVVDAPLGQRLGELALGVVPELVAAQAVVGSRRELRAHLEAEERVEVVGEVQAALDLVEDLVLGAEDVGVVLDEVADAQQAVQRAAGLAAVQQARLGAAERQVAVAPALQPEELRVARGSSSA